MKYTKPALSFDQQAQRLLDRGLIVSNQETLKQYLSRVNYYRLSAYWYFFKYTDPQTGEEKFAPDTHFNTIWRRYTFDRELRLLVLDAIEHIEVAILRTRMVEQFTLEHGPFGYCDPVNFNPAFPLAQFNRLISEIDQAVDNSSEEFVARYKAKYDGEHLPLWMTAEVMTFGQLYTFYRNMHRREQQMLANQFRVAAQVLSSWLHTLNFVRNACAHHSRLWNRQLPIRPLIPYRKNDPNWHTPVKFDNRWMFATLTMIWYLLRIIHPQSNWHTRFEALLAEYPEIPLHLMGIPTNWRECRIWGQGAR